MFTCLVLEYALSIVGILYMPMVLYVGTRQWYYFRCVRQVILMHAVLS